MNTEHEPTDIPTAPASGSTPMDTLWDESSRHEVHALIAHELKAPLTVIKGYLEILGRSEDDETRVTALAAADQAADRLGTMLDDLLAASTDLHVFAPRRLAQTSLFDLASRVSDELRPLHDHSIAVHGDTGSVRCDESLMRQVLGNLIGNALKHTPDGGRIDIRVAVDVDGAIVTIEDDGPGVPPEDRERVFELFARLEARGELPPGLGLGLPVSRVIAEQHGGSLQLVDGSGDGACFELVVPAGT